jgi:multidrug resistance efflux pump
MDINEAVKIANDFRSYNDIGDKNLITKYSLETLRTALNKYLPTDKGSLWYKAIEARIEELARDKEAKLAKSKEIKKTVELI